MHSIPDVEVFEDLWVKVVNLSRDIQNVPNPALDMKVISNTCRCALLITPCHNGISHTQSECLLTLVL